MEPDFEGRVRLQVGLTRKTDLQCRERFSNILDPSLLKNPKIRENELMTIVHYVVFDKPWSWVAKHITSGMTDNDVYRHFRNFKERKSKPFKDIVMGKRKGASNRQ